MISGLILLVGPDQVPNLIIMELDLEQTLL
jgi:hypothetical protein